MSAGAGARSASATIPVVTGTGTTTGTIATMATGDRADIVTARLIIAMETGAMHTAVTVMAEADIAIMTAIQTVATGPVVTSGMTIYTATTGKEPV